MRKLLALSLVVLSFSGVLAQTAGVVQEYTLGGTNPSFPTTDSMKRFLYSQTIAWPPIVIRVRTGNYGSLVLDKAIPGCSNDNPIRIVADTGAIPVFDGGSLQPGLVLGNTCGWFFEGIVFGNLKDGLSGVRLDKDVRDVTFHNCNFYAMESDSVVEKIHCGLIADQVVSGNGRNVCLTGNLFRGGWANIYLNQPASHPDSVSFFIDSNRLYGAKAYGLCCLGHSYMTSFSCNKVTSPEWASDFTCISIRGNMVGVVGCNHLEAIASHSSTGISLYGSPGDGNSFGQVQNNVVFSRAPIALGICSEGQNAKYKFVHNTVFAKGASSGNFNYSYAVKKSSYSTMYNNVLLVEGKNGRPLYATDDWNFSFYKQDYNCYYHVSGYCYESYSLANLQQIYYNLDQHSIFKPFFFPEDSASWLKSDYSEMLCPSRKEVEKDIFGNLRNGVTVMGAFQPFRSGGADISLLSLIDTEYDFVRSSADTMLCSLEIKECGPQKVCFSKNSPIVADVYRNGRWVTRQKWYSGCVGFLERDTLEGLALPVTGDVDTFCFVICYQYDTFPENDTLIAIFETAVATVPYETGFSEMPVGMRVRTNYGSGGWWLCDSLSPFSDVLPFEGNGMLVFTNGTGQPCIAQAYWNAFSLKNTLLPKVGFWHTFSGKASGSDMLVVKVITDGGRSFSELGRIPANNSSNVWRYYEYDLSGFTSEECLSIVLEAVSFSDAVQCVDKFSITIEQDMAVGWVRPAVDSSEICGLNGVPLQVVLRNLSARPKTLLSDTVAVRVGGAANRSYYMTYSNTLAAFASDTLVMDSAADFSVQGDYFVEVCCQSVDCNTANDTLRDSVRVEAGFSIDSVSVVSDQGVIVQGGSFKCGFRIRNTGNTAIAYPKVVLETNEEIRWSAKLPFCLGAGDSVWFDIPEPISVPAVSSDQPFFMLTLSVSQPCAADTFVQQSLFEVFLPDSASLGLACFLYPLPSDTLVSGSRVVPRVRILNDGNVAVRSLPVSLRLYDADMMLYDSVTCFLSYLLEKDTADFTFPSGCKVPSDGSRCLLQVFIPSLDSNATDDTLEVWCPIRMVMDTTAVPEWKWNGWLLGQNIPNPAAGKTLVPVTLPELGTVRLQVFAADGRLLYRDELELPSGKSLLPLETGRYAAGVYFYSVEYKGGRKVRKMVVE